jgi:hypothetical protein
MTTLSRTAAGRFGGVCPILAVEWAIMHNLTLSRRRWRTAVFITLGVTGAMELVAACGGGTSGPPELSMQDSDVPDNTTPTETSYEASPTPEAARDVASETSSGADSGDSGECEGGGTVCSGLCTDTQTDPGNCGTCGNSCGTASSGFECIMGKCKCEADAGEVLCGTVCVDILTDNNNCGACHHICQEVQGTSSTCSAGTCQPAVIASPGQPIWGIAVDSTYVWWTQPGTPGSPQSGALLRKAFAAGSADDEVVMLLNDPRGIAIDNINVYWVDYLDSSVNQIKVAVGGQVLDYPQLNAEGGDISPPYANPISVTNDANNVYWVSNVAGGCVLSVPIGNPGGLEPKVIQCGEDNPWAITTDSTNVYWVDQGSGASNGLVRQKAVDGSGTALSLSTGEANPFAIAVDGKNVYWVDNVNGTGTVKQAAIGSTGSAMTLAQGEGAPYGIAIDANNVYWTDFSDNTVNAVPIGSTTKTVYAVNQSSPAAIAVDKVNIYWVNQSTQQILGVTK